MKNGILLLFIFFTVSVSCNSKKTITEESNLNNEPINKVVIILVDGIPADVVESTETPAIDEISAQGGYARALMGGVPGTITETPTVSAVGYNSMLTGVWAYKHNVWGNGIKDPNYNYPTIFKLVSDHRPNAFKAIYSTWEDNRTKLLGEGLPGTNGLKLEYAFDGFENDTIKFPHLPDRKFIFDIDEMVSKEAANHILETGPDISWVYLEFTDDMGHKFGDSPQMVDAVKLADKQIKRIWDSVQKREQNFNEKWMILITTDHGRNSENGKGHGGQSEREKTIWISTNVDSLNELFTNNTSQMVDIMPSVADFMKIDLGERINNELDGTSFIGDLAASHLKAEVLNDSLLINWTSFKKGSAELYYASTDNFMDGGNDKFIFLSKVDLNTEEFIVLKPDSISKIVLRTSFNSLAAPVK